MGFRADPVELRGLEAREGGEYPEYECRVSLRGIAKIEHPGCYHGAFVGRPANTLKLRKPESSVASWAFRFAGSFPGVLTVLSGMTYMEHLEDNLRTFTPLDPLTDDDKVFLEETAQLMLRYPTIPCNDCKYCMPCPYGLDIPAVLLHYNKCINEGNVPASAQDENYRKARRAFLVGYDRSVPRLRQASHCIGCNQCVHHCPQGINIPKEMQRIDHFVEDLKQERVF